MLDILMIHQGVWSACIVICCSTCDLANSSCTWIPSTCTFKHHTRCQLVSPVAGGNSSSYFRGTIRVL